MQSDLRSRRPARWGSILHWESAGARAAASSKSTGPNRRGRRRLPAGRRTGGRRQAALPRTSTPRTLGPVYAGKLGVNVGEMPISQPDTGEQGLEIADMLVRSGGVDIIVIDSVAALVPKANRG